MRSIAKTFLTLFLIVLVLFGIFRGYKKVQSKLYPLKYSEYVEKYSEEYGVDKFLVYSVIKCESGYDEGAVSQVGAKGLMQMTDDTFEWLQTKEAPPEHYDSDMLFKPEISIKYGTFFLSLTLREFGDETAAVAAYHAGMTSVSNWLNDKSYSSDGKILDEIPYGDTKAYVERVFKVKNTYISLYGEKNG